MAAVLLETEPHLLMKMFLQLAFVFSCNVFFVCLINTVIVCCPSDISVGNEYLSWVRSKTIVVCLFVFSSD